MKYVCLGYHDEMLWNAMPDHEREEMLADSFAYANVLRENGHILADQGLQSAQSAVTLRFDKSTVAVTDGPFAETKEQLGGFILLEANDLNDAIRIMSKMPCMRIGGSIEIRPVNEDLNSQAAAATAAARV